MDEFKLGKPVVVCRWRLANRELPLESRHIRALQARSASCEYITTGLVAWVKQHIEWTLSDGSATNPNGVLMLVVDEDGKAAMSVGEYKPLLRCSANDLLFRAQGSWREAEGMRVSPEDLWVVRNDALVWGTSPEFHPAGASSLIADLARTLGIPVLRKEDLLEQVARHGFQASEVFLVSDEHGVVPASDRSGERAKKFCESYKKLLAQR